MLLANGKHQPGLQIASAIGSSFRNFLGPSKSAKFFVEQDGLESVTVTSTRQLLQFLDLQHPVGEMIASAVQSHDSVYGCYSTTIVVLLGHWCEEFRSLLSKGYPIQTVLALGDELLESCINAVQKSTISLNQLRASHKQLRASSQKHTNSANVNPKHDKSTSIKTSEVKQNFNISEELEFMKAEDYGIEQGVVRGSNFEHLESTKKEIAKKYTRKTRTLQCSLDTHGAEELVSESNIKSMKSHGKDIPREEIRKTGHTSTVRHSSSVKVDSLTSKEVKSNKWSTYQDILEDEDVSWFFTQDPNDESLDSLMLQELTNVQKPTYHHPEQSDQKLATGGGLTKVHDMCSYNLGMSVDKHLNIADVSPQHLGSKVNLVESQETHCNYLDHRKNYNMLDSSEDHEFPGCFYNLSNLHDMEQEKHFSNQQNHKSVMNSCQKNPDSDDEFAVCFDNLPILHNIEQEKHFFTHLNQNAVKSSQKDPDSDDEFAGCFDGLPNLTKDENTIQNASIFMEDTESQSSLDQDFKQSAKTDDINDLIKRKLEKSSRLQLAKGILQSRHFRTMGDSKVEMACNSSKELKQAFGSNISERFSELSNVNLNYQMPMTGQNEEIVKGSILMKGQGSDEADKDVLQAFITTENLQNKDLSREAVVEHSQKTTHDLLDSLGPALSYGPERLMVIAVEIFKSRLTSEFDIMNTKPLHICKVLGPSFLESRVEAGLILPITSHQVSLVKKFNKAHFRMLLLSGDADSKYHHLGYKESIQPNIEIKNKLTGQRPHKDWKQKVLGLLKQLDINILVVKGTVDGSLCEACLAENIVVVQQVRYSALRLLSTGSGATIVTYVLDAEETDIGEVTSLNLMEGGHTEGHSSKGESMQNFLICIQTKSSQQTAVLCAPSQYLLDGLEDQFMSCINRLTQAVTDRKILPGAGYTETVAISHLDQKATTEFEISDLVYRQDVAKAMQSGWTSYLLQLTYNCKEITDWTQGMDNVLRAVNTHASPCGCDVHSVVDCVSAKMSAWRTAWQLLRIILLTDVHVTTGEFKQRDTENNCNAALSMMSLSKLLSDCRISFSIEHLIYQLYMCEKIRSFNSLYFQ